MPVFLIGGAEKAAELDAKRAIDQGTRLAAVVEDAKTGDVYNAPESLKAKVCLENKRADDLLCCCNVWVSVMCTLAAHGWIRLGNLLMISILAVP